MSRLRKIAFLDMDIGSRDAAISYIEGKVYKTETHAQAIQQYYKEHSRYDDEYPEFLDDDYMRPENSELREADIYRFAFAHLQEGGKQELDENNQPYEVPRGIYIEITTVSGVDLDTVVKAFKENFPGYDIYEYDSWKNIEDGKNFKKIARLKKMR